jgi:proteasome lid subunit RPN8/RPN11
MTSVHDTAHYESQRSPGRAAAQALTVPQAAFDAVRAHGESTYPHECCGILLGRVSAEGIAVEEAVRAGNTRLDSARNRYNIEPGDLIRAQREGRARGLDIVGFYHSHPDHPAFWSPTDLAEAHWYGCAYVITSIDGKNGAPRAHETNSFLLAGSSEEDKTFHSQPITVT